VPLFRELTEQKKMQDTSISLQVFKDSFEKEIGKTSKNSFIMCREIFSEGMRHLLRIWKSTIQDFSKKQGNLNCRGK
jgi:hypothetical protein